MATTYKTPGVYVEEIPKFPPSVAPVDTAIPAFIGYTEKAIDRDGRDLTLKPKRIESLVEYEQYFGGAQPETRSPSRSRRSPRGARQAGRHHRRRQRSPRRDRSKHIMYYALQLFYANGGKSCYIVSVGPYKARVGDALVETELEAGLDAAGEGRRADPDRDPRGAGARHRRLRHAAGPGTRAVRRRSRTAS